MKIQEVAACKKDQNSFEIKNNSAQNQVLKMFPHVDIHGLSAIPRKPVVIKH